MQNPQEIINTLQQQGHTTNEEFTQTLDDHIIMETIKLGKLEKQEYQWISQARVSLSKFENTRSHIQQLLSSSDDKTRLLGQDIINIQDQAMYDKMESLYSITTLTIDIRNTLQTWEEFQHQLSVFVESIVEVCVQQYQSTSHNIP